MVKTLDLPDNIKSTLTVVTSFPHDYRTGDQMRGLLDLLIDLPEELRAWPMIEIGSNTGDSAQMFSLFFRQVYCIDAFIEDYYMNVSGEEVYKRFISKTADRNIELVRCLSGQAFDKPYREQLPEKAGLIYIDCDHSYPSVKRDIFNSWPVLIDGGILCGHDYGLISPGQDGVKTAVDEIFGRPDRVYIDTSWKIRKIDGRMIF